MSDLGKWFHEAFAEAENTFEFRLEEKLLDFTEDVCRLMAQKDISRSELARRLGKKKSYITRIFNVPSNLTFATMLQLADALEVTLEIKLASTSSAAEIPARETSRVAPAVVQRLADWKNQISQQEEFSQAA